MPLLYPTLVVAPITTNYTVPMCSTIIPPPFVMNLDHLLVVQIVVN